GPGVRLAVADDDLVVEDPVESRLVHRPGERAQAAVAQAVEAGQVGVADRDALQGRRPAAEVLGLLDPDGALDGVTQPPVGRDQLWHRSNSLISPAVRRRRA